MGKISPAKARKMLRDNSAQGHPLTQKQKGLFYAAAEGGKTAYGKAKKAAYKASRKAAI